MPRANQAWGDAVRTVRGSGGLIEDVAMGTWALGANLDNVITAGWPDGRAGVVLEVLQNYINVDGAIQNLPVELQDWINEQAA